MLNTTIVGFHLGERVDLTKLINTLTYSVYYKDQTEMIYQISDYSYFQITDYGSIVFLGVENHLQSNILHTVRTLLNIPEIELQSDNFKIEINPEAHYKTLFDKIILPELNLDIIRVLMLNLSQSVALDFYIEQSDKLLQETEKISNELEQSGTFSIKGKKLLQFIGKTLNLRNKITYNLYVFETSDISWNNELLNNIEKDLNRELDIKIRYKSLQENLDTVKENLDIFKDLHHHSNSSKLEWIVIILIALEIINILFEKLH
jgi:uncharacterized Rmd1/YagE family protein